MTRALASPQPAHSAPAGPVHTARALAEARVWLARELHDGVVQRLTTMVVELELLKRQATPGDDVDTILHSARSAVSDLRRVLGDLREEPSVQAGFVESVGDLVADLTTRSGIRAELAVQSCPDGMPLHAAANLRGIVSEALVNVRRHSGAARVTVTVQVVEEALAVTIADDGAGFIPSAGHSGFGIEGMRERALLLGGRLVHDAVGGRGTTVRCIVPLARLR